MRASSGPWRREIRSMTGPIALALLAAIGAPDAAHAQSPALGDAATAVRAAEALDGEQRVFASLDRRGDLTLRNSTLEGALFTISELWGINIVAGGVEGAVNGVFKDAPLREILDSILLANGYAYRPVGASLVVSKLADLGQVNPFFVSETIPVGAAEVQEVVEAARLMSTPQGQVRALPAAGAILVVDFPDRVQKIRDLVKQIAATSAGRGRSTGNVNGPQQVEVVYARMHYVPAADAVAALTAVLSPVGRIASVDAENRLVVIDYPENVRMVEAVIARIDRPRPQVNIKALIYDIALSDLEEIGINWNALSSGTVDPTTGAPTAGNGLLANSVTKQPFGGASPGNTFSFFSLNSNFNLQAVIRALQRAEDSRLLADPNVTVQDNEQASIESISEIPFQQLTQTAAGGQIGTTSFKQAGIKLDVLPHIARDGTIDLTVVPEYSRLAGFTPGDNQPIIDTRRATTRLRIADRQTLMIAGMRQRSDVGDFNGIPYLKDIRYLGHLFRARSTTIEESELVVFLTPEIVGYSDELGARDRMTADTIRCRLERIPGAEGCPTCDACAPSAAPCETGEPHEAGLADERMTPPDGATDPRVVPADALPTEPADDVNEVLPIGAESAGALLKYPEIATKNPRRLPTARVASRPVDATSPIGSANKSASDRVTEAVFAPEPRGMRRDYDSRFRATGNVYPDRAKLATLPAELQGAAAATPEAKPAKPKKSMIDRLLLR
ncbi:MAG: secretin N-terminal domain-containing protein [Lacipirellulaceae bacterium]